MKEKIYAILTILLMLSILTTQTFSQLDPGEGGSDNQPPYYWQKGVNSTYVNSPCQFYCYWTDAMIYSFIFGSNITGQWQNDTEVIIMQTGYAWTNVTKTNPISVGTKVTWQIWARNLSGNWNTTGIQSYITTQVPTIDEALSLANQYIDRAYYQINSTHAVAKEYPSLPLRVKDKTNNKWISIGKDECNKGVFEGGCKIVPIKTGHAFEFGDNNERWYKFDVGDNYDYEDLVVWCEDTSANATHQWYHVAIKNYPQANRFDLYIEDQLIIQNCYYDAGYTGWKENGFMSTRYVLRHSTRLMQYYYEDINNTDKASKLQNTMDTIGYTKEFYAPIWNKSNTYRDDPYIDETMYPDHFSFVDLSLIYTDPNAMPYRSNLADFWTYEMWYQSIRYLGNPSMNGIYAIHYLNKYPNNATARQQAENNLNVMIKAWDGYGIKSKSSAYGTWSTSVFLIALGRMYQETGNNTYLIIARECAGYLLQLQLPLGYPIYVDEHGTYYDAGSVGGFLISYGYNGEPFYKGQQSYSLLQWGMDIYDAIGKVKGDRDEYKSVILTNTETTILATKALMFFKTLNVAPIFQPSVSHYNPIYLPSWTTNQAIGSTAQAYPDAYIELRSQSSFPTFAEATTFITFEPTENKMDISIAFEYLGYVQTSSIGSAILKYQVWLYDVTSQQIKWNSSWITMENYGASTEKWFNNTKAKIWNQPYYFPLDPPHTYKLYVQFRIEAQNGLFDLGSQGWTSFGEFWDYHIRIENIMVYKAITEV